MKFKFQIGDLVVPITVARERLDMMLQTREIMSCGSARIIERRSVECVGGTQLFYVSSNNDGGTAVHAEDSLLYRHEFMVDWVAGVRQCLREKP